MIRWGRRRRWATAAAVSAVAVAGGAGWWIDRGLRPCGSLDRRLERSGCSAVYGVPRFVSAESLNWPGMVFTPDGRRVSVVGIDLQPTGSSSGDRSGGPSGGSTGGQEGSSQPPPQRVALATIDVGTGKVVQRDTAAPYRRSLLGPMGVSWDGRLAAGVFFESGSSGAPSPEQTGGAPGGADQAGATGAGRVRLWRLDGRPGGWRSPVAQLPTSNASRIEFSSDGVVLRAGERWWDARTGTPLSAKQANRHPWLRGWGTGTVLSPDGALKVGWDDGGRVTVADAASGRIIRRLSADPDPGPDSGPGRVIGPWFHFSRSGQRLAMLATQTGRRDTWLRVWQVGTGASLRTLGSPLLGTRSAWSPDEHLLAVSTHGKNSDEGDGIALIRLP